MRTITIPVPDPFARLHRAADAFVLRDTEATRRELVAAGKAAEEATVAAQARVRCGGDCVNAPLCEAFGFCRREAD